MFIDLWESITVNFHNGDCSVFGVVLKQFLRGYQAVLKRFFDESTVGDICPTGLRLIEFDTIHYSFVH